MIADGPESASLNERLARFALVRSLWGATILIFERYYYVSLYTDTPRLKLYINISPSNLATPIRRSTIQHLGKMWHASIIGKALVALIALILLAIVLQLLAVMLSIWRIVGVPIALLLAFVFYKSARVRDGLYSRAQWLRGVPGFRSGDPQRMAVAMLVFLLPASIVWTFSMFTSPREASKASQVVPTAQALAQGVLSTTPQVNSQPTISPAQLTNMPKPTDMAMPPTATLIQPFATSVPPTATMDQVAQTKTTASNTLLAQAVASVTAAAAFTSTPRPTNTSLPPTFTVAPPTKQPAPTFTQVVAQAPVPTKSPVPPPTNTVVPAQTVAPAQPPPPQGANVKCNQQGTTQICAWISDPTPTQNTRVTVFARLLVNGAGQSGQAMQAIWNYKSSTPDCSGVTGGDGQASCTRDISRATVGYQVDVDVSIGSFKVTTWFTPR
ncbi:MAG: hypothetical protein EXR62_07775 [Chloroflexi bacterium]|nr:hypothetical protein [Chloroflexota bacterium]